MFAVYFISYHLAVNNATNELMATKQRCGHDPIGISPRLANVSGQTNGYKVRIAKSTGWENEKYFCTVTEYINAGYLVKAPEDIKLLYP